MQLPMLKWMRKYYHRALNWTNSMKRVRTAHDNFFCPFPLLFLLSFPSTLSSVSSLSYLPFLTFTLFFILLYTSTLSFSPLLLSLTLNLVPLHLSLPFHPSPIWLFSSPRISIIADTTIVFQCIWYQIISEFVCNNSYHNI